MSNLRLFFRLQATALRSEFAYPASALLLMLGVLMLTLIEFLSIVALFERFGQIRGWTLPEVALLYAMACASFALAGMVLVGFEAFSQDLKAGEFDRVLLRPRPAALQLAGRRVAPRRFGRFLQGAAIFCWALPKLAITWTPQKFLLLTAGIFGGALVFGAIFVLQATLSFWTTESLEVVHILTYGGLSAAQYPVSIYQGPLRDFVTYVLPLAAVNYLPALALLERPGELGLPTWAPWAAPLVGPTMFLVALTAFRFGIRRYQSTGS